MLRRALLTLSIMCGLTAAALWWVSRNGEKIIYLDARHTLLGIRLGEIVTERGGSLYENAKTTRYGLCLTVHLGVLVMRSLEIAEVSSPASVLFRRIPRTTEQIVGAQKWCVPLEPVVGICGVMTIALWAPPRLRTLLRRRRNQCLSCGYSLRGLTSDRCPECGSPADPPEREEQSEACNQPQ